MAVYDPKRSLVLVPQLRALLPRCGPRPEANQTAGLKERGHPQGSNQSPHAWLSFQLAFDLVEEAPIRVLSDELLRARADQPRLVQPQCIEDERILRIKIAPNVVADLVQCLKRIVIALRVSLIDEQLRSAAGLRRAEIGGLEDRTQHSFGGNRIFAGKLSVGRQHATIMLRPRAVGDAADDNMSDVPGANFL